MRDISFYFVKCKSFEIERNKIIYTFVACNKVFAWNKFVLFSTKKISYIAHEPTIHWLYSYNKMKHSKTKYRQTSNISRALVGNDIFDHTDVVGRCSNYIFILDFTTGFNGLGKYNC